MSSSANASSLGQISDSGYPFRALLAAQYQPSNTNDKENSDCDERRVDPRMRVCKPMQDFCLLIVFLSQDALLRLLDCRRALGGTWRLFIHSLNISNESKLKPNAPFRASQNTSKYICKSISASRSTKSRAMWAGEKVCALQPRKRATGR